MKIFISKLILISAKCNASYMSLAVCAGIEKILQWVEYDLLAKDFRIFGTDLTLGQVHILVKKQMKM